MTERRSRPTSQDVAREAGVAQSTVSIALSGGPDADRVSPETKGRVFAAARRLGYRRNSIGAALRRGYSDTIVLLAVTWELASSHSDTSMSVSRAAAACGLATIVHVAADDEEAIDFLNNVSSLNPYGLLFMWDSGSLPEEVLASLAAERMPMVNLMPSGTGAIPSVTADRGQGFYLATQHLIELGHRNIGLIFDSARPTGRHKAAGYRAALEAAGIDPDESLLQETGLAYFEAGHLGFRELIERRPDTTAVLCVDDTMAIGVIVAAQDLGLSVPGDISVVGSGAGRESLYSRPSLTTIALPFDKIAEDAVSILSRMRKEPDCVPESILEPVELVVRGSTGPAPRGESVRVKD